MAAFTDLDWRRIDTTAIVTFGGLATIDERRHAACRAWLIQHNYAIDTLSCGAGLAVAVPDLGKLLQWQEKFDYPLEPENRNLDALRDGFHFDIPEGRGRVLEVIRADKAWREDRRWFCGMLAIAQKLSREQLALGRRFFVLLVVPKESRIIGAAIEQTTIPELFWNPCREIHEFESQTQGM
jgi:hypothetical protein